VLYALSCYKTTEGDLWKKNQTKFLIILLHAIVSLLNVPRVSLGLAGIKAVHTSYKYFLTAFPIGLSLGVDIGFLYFQTQLYVKANFNKKSKTLKYLRVYLVVISIATVLCFSGLAVAGFFDMNPILYLRLMVVALLVNSFFFGGYCLFAAILIFNMASKMNVETAKSYAPVKKAFLIPNFYLFVLAVIFATLLILEIYYLSYDYILFSLLDTTYGTLGLMFTYLLLVVKPIKTEDNEASYGSHKSGGSVNVIDHVNSHKSGGSNNVEQ